MRLAELATVSNSVCLKALCVGVVVVLVMNFLTFSEIFWQTNQNKTRQKQNKTKQNQLLLTASTPQPPTPKSQINSGRGRPGLQGNPPEGDHLRREEDQLRPPRERALEPGLCGRLTSRGQVAVRADAGD